MATGIDTTEVLKRLETIQSDIQDIKLSQARTEERFNSIDQRFNSIDQRFDSLEASFNQRIDSLETSLNQRIDSLDKSVNKRIDSLEQRANGQETRFWSLVAILVTTLLGIVGKVVFFPVYKL
jgi:DNA anti-recombination protein RmuC